LALRRRIGASRTMRTSSSSLSMSSGGATGAALGDALDLRRWLLLVLRPPLPPPEWRLLRDLGLPPPLGELRRLGEREDGWRGRGPWNETASRSSHDSGWACARARERQQRPE